jgi:hypothetical protein
MLTATADGAVALYFDDSKKFETTSTGATVTGDILVDGGNITLGTDSVAGNVLTPSDVLAFTVDSNANTSGTPNIQFKVGTSEKMRITSTGLVGIGLTNPDTIFNVKSSGSNADEISLTHSGNTVKIASLGQESGHGSLRLRNNSGVSTISVSTDGTDSTLNNGTGDLFIQNTANDKDIIFKSDDGSGGTTEYFKLDGSDNVLRIHKRTIIDDNVKIDFGGGQDLQIYHDGSNSYVEQAGTGDLIIRNSADDKDIIFKSDDGSGGTTEYFRLDGGLGYNAASKHIQMTDGQAFYAGSGNDLGIFHNGTQSKIENLTGDLTIEQFADDKDIIFKSDDGSGGTTEYFKLDGNNVNVRVSQNFSFNDSVKASFGNSGDLQIYHSGSASLIDNTTATLFIRQFADNEDIRFQCDDGSGGVTSYIELDGNNVSTKILTQKVIMSNLPTSDPNNAGQLYNDSGTLKISAG